MGTQVGRGWITDEMFTHHDTRHFSKYLISYPRYQTQYHHHNFEVDEGEGVRETNPADRA